MAEPRLPVHWRPGEHILVIGQTGRGKTYLAARLLKLRPHVVAFKTKDDPEDAVTWRGYARIRRSRDIDNVRHDRFLLMPGPALADKAREGRELLARIKRQRHWCLYIDEMLTAEHRLRLTDPIEELLTEGRSAGISIVAGAQRPVDISRYAGAMASHAFVFRGDGGDARTIGERLTSDLRPIVPRLGDHEFAFFSPINSILIRSTARSLSRLLVSDPGP